MKVLVTGGAGYIGSHMNVELFNAGYEVVVLDNFYNSCEEAIHRVEKLCNKKIAFYQGDMRDEACLDRLFPGGNRCSHPFCRVEGSRGVLRKAVTIF